ncbi:hypothetical protein BCR33DRAFT_850716 [Rhizoclosmatium globosum]|uniref:Uncharacterized protein n=1 Tax=Rhizoclosmatium globosum TaxID=329046 RepID=A0A1Y2CAK4_9FUNG|nr:hypothetical protein BCR33DRAFT_850716 [Rhizoclosmatium globosum]|eukprot:ORY44062.1 hypothetical protein BCR33DRAFT_850716 [Rhizoclosmatium globosum]
MSYSMSTGSSVTFVFRRSRTLALKGKRGIEVLQLKPDGSIDPEPVALVHQMDFSAASPYTLCNFRIQSTSNPNDLLDFEPHGYALGFSIRDRDFKSLSYDVNAMRTMNSICDITMSRTALSWAEQGAQYIKYEELKRIYQNRTFPTPKTSPQSLGEDYKTVVAMEVSNKYKKPLDRIVYRIDADQPVGFGPPPPEEAKPMHALGIKLDDKKFLKLSDDKEYKVNSVLELRHGTGLQSVPSEMYFSRIPNEGQVFAVASVDRLKFYRGKWWEEVEIWDGIGGVEDDGEFPVFGSVKFNTNTFGFGQLGLELGRDINTKTLVLLGSLLCAWQSDCINPRGPFQLRNLEIKLDRGRQAFWMAATGICEIM